MFRYALVILVLLAIWLATTIVLYNTTGCESASVVVVNSSGQDSPMLVIRNYDEVLWKGTLLYPRARAVTVPVHSTGILTVEAMLEDGTFLRSEGGPYVEVMNSGTSLFTIERTHIDYSLIQGSMSTQFQPEGIVYFLLEMTDIALGYLSCPVCAGLNAI